MESTRPTLSAAKLMGARPSQPHDPFHRHACKTNKLLVFHTATACARVAMQAYQPTILHSAAVSAVAVTTTRRHYIFSSRQYALPLRDIT